MPTYILNYFPGRGLTEISRQMLHISETPYEDCRINYEDWPAMKPNSRYDEIPTLNVDGEYITNSFEIARFLAEKLGFNGKNYDEASKALSIGKEYMSYFADCRSFLMNLYGFEEGDKDKLRKESGEPARDKFFTSLEQRVKENGSNGHLIGDSLTWIDLLIAYHIDVLLSHIPGFFDKYPKMMAVKDSVRSNPKLNEWIHNNSLKN